MFTTTVIWFIFLLTISIMVKDYTYIINNPLRFCLETIGLALLTLLTLFLISMSRKVVLNKTLMFIMFAQFIIFNILFQLSGMYSYTSKMIGN